MWTIALLIGTINNNIPSEMLMFSFVFDSITVFLSISLANLIKKEG